MYVSEGADDAARYVAYLGPTFMGKILGTAGTTIQHLSPKEDIRMASDEQTVLASAEFLRKNPKILEEVNNSLYSYPFDYKITNKHVDMAIANPNSDEAKKLAYSLMGNFGDADHSDMARDFYKHVRSKGFDAIPDFADRLAGTSVSASIIINPDKIEMTSSTTISKEVFKDAKAYIKSIEKLKISDLLK